MTTKKQRGEEVEAVRALGAFAALFFAFVVLPNKLINRAREDEEQCYGPMR